MSGINPEGNNMKVIPVHRDQLLTVGDLEKFKYELIDKIKDLLQDESGQTKRKWLRSSEVRKMLGISPGTLQNLRVNGTLPFSKIGGIVFYQLGDLHNLLEGSLKTNKTSRG